jgi:hypothetical protein
MKRRYVIQGSRFGTLGEFAEHFSAVVLGRDHMWGGNLDALDDILRGGFGTPDEGFILIWKDHHLSRERLGHPETVRWLEGILTTCHPANRDRVESEIEAARAGRGPTIFDHLVEIIESHGPSGQEPEDGVELRLE